VTDEASRRNRQSDYLFLQLGNLGFEVPDEPPGGVEPADGYIVNPELGIWIHATNEMIRLVVLDAGTRPGYRLVLGRRDLSRAATLDIMAVHARAAAAERSRP
jgi:hypothetical protein